MIRFLRDYRGKLTRERLYRLGDVVSLPAEAAIVERGAAEWADQPTVEDSPLPDTPKPDNVDAPDAAPDEALHVVAQRGSYYDLSNGETVQGKAALKELGVEVP